MKLKSAVQRQLSVWFHFRILSPTKFRKYFFPYAFFIFLPISVISYLLEFNPILVSVVTILAIIPITGLMARSTQDLSVKSGTILSSLLNITFGNAFELITGVFAIRAGLVEMVKASIIGSIIQNVLLIVGLSMLFGGLKYREQRFNRSFTSVASSMLLIAVAGLSLPTVFTYLTGRSPLVMHQTVAVILAVTYILSLVFSLFTHRHLFKTSLNIPDENRWTIRKSIVVLLMMVILAIIESNILVNSIEPLIKMTGLSQVFVGLIVIAVIGNLPELMTAVNYGIRNNITQSLEIGMNSAIQIALFAVPVLVFISPLVGNGLTLVFEPFQLAVMILAIFIINYIGSDGICNWLEGIQLITVYAIIAIAFYFI